MITAMRISASCRANADLDQANNAYTITITVDEGERYAFGDISVESSIKGVDTARLKSLVKTTQGHVYSAKAVEDSLIALTEYMAGKGYAFAQVTPRGDRDFSEHTIGVDYSIDEGPRAYIERIEIRGNTRTRDYVIRREFDVNEGDAFNQVLIQRAKRRLDDLGYFTSVQISTAPGSAPDKVVLIVNVTEKSTGELSVGAGYSTSQTDSSASGFTLEGAIGEKNFLGRGQSISASLAGGKGSRDYQLSFTEPYFLGRRIAAGFDLYRQTRTYTNYTSTLNGGTVRFGLPISQALSTQLAYNLVKESYGYTSTCDAGRRTGLRTPDAASRLPLPTAIEVQSPWIKSSVSGSLILNTIDEPAEPA